MTSGICLECHCLVDAKNQSRTTAELGKPLYCAACDEFALAHVMNGRASDMLALLQNKGFNDQVNKVVRMLIARLRKSFGSLVALRRAGCFVEGNHDPATILRAMYDASLQVEYILHNSSKATALAQDFIDFQEIERHENIKALDRYQNEFVRKIASNPLRAINEAAFQAKFKKIESKFRNKKGTKYRDKWHGKNLRDLCKTKTREEEFDFMIVNLHGATHSSPQTLFSGSAVAPSIILLLAGKLVLRAIAAALDYNKVQVNAELAAEIEVVRHNLIKAFGER
jgi:hypothetical protein